MPWACLGELSEVCGLQYVAIHLRDPKFREAHEFRKLVRTNIETKVFEKTKHFENRWTGGQNELHYEVRRRP